MTKDEALRMAIEHLKEAENIIEGKCEKGGYFQKPIQACKEALAETQEPKNGIELEWYCKGWDDAEKDLATQEPVAYVVAQNDGDIKSEVISEYLKIGTELYTTPLSRAWVGLSDDEIEEVFNLGHKNFKEFARAIEAKLKEKNELFGNSR